VTLAVATARYLHAPLISPASVVSRQPPKPQSADRLYCLLAADKAVASIILDGQQWTDDIIYTAAAAAAEAATVN